MKYTLTSTQLWRLVRWIATVLGVVLLAAFISWLTVPSYVKNTLVQEVQAQTGRLLTIKKVAFNPFTFTLEFTDVVLYEEDKNARAFSADDIALTISPTSIFHAAPVISELVLRYPFLKLERKQRDGKDESNFGDVFKKLAARPSQGKPLQFSVSNIQLIGGVLHFDDQVLGKHVHIEAINFGLPFVSNFASKVETFIEPHLSAKVDGSWFELKGRSKPFWDTRETSLEINTNRVDLMSVIPFLPKPLPYKVDSAKLSSRLSLQFSTQKNVAQILLSGSASLNDIALTDMNGAPLLRTKVINVNIKEANLTTAQISLNSIGISDPELWLGINQRGAMNWATLQSDKKSNAENTSTFKPIVDIARFHLKNGKLHWNDAINASPALDLQLAKVNIEAEKISTDDKAKPASMMISIGDDGKSRARFVGTLDASRAALSGEFIASDVALSDYQPYFNRTLAANLSGNASIKTQLAIQKSNVKLERFFGAVEELKLKPINLDKSSPSVEDGGISAKKIAIDGMSLNNESKQTRIEKITLDRVKGEIYRDTDGSVNLSRLMKKAEKTAVAARQEQSSGWQTDINQIALNNSDFVFGDKSKKPAVNIRANDVDAKFEQISSKSDKPIKMTLQATFDEKGKPAGKVDLNGLITAKNTQLTIDLQDFSVVALQPYFTDFLNIKLEKGAVSTNGQLVWNAPSSIAYQGNLKLANFSSLTKETSDTFLKWKMLEINGIDVDLGAKPKKITLAKIDVSNFYARAILSEKGRLNLENIVVHEHAGAVAEPKTQTTATKNVATVPLTPAPKSDDAPQIKIGQVNLHSGVINYTDNFIKPHYSMRMTSMNGTIGTIQSERPQPAPINLKGKLDDEAPVAISGALNPLFNPIVLDIKMSATGIDLPRLTAYSAKYAGYPIQKGKLSFDVEYKVKDNQLTANNSLRIDQLTFGERVDSPDAIDAPILFVVSLLTDRNGRLNLDVPISGTINDPEFTLGGLVFKVIMNMIGKAITSPFALLGNIFSGGGSEELSYVEFASGSAALTDATKAKLDSIAKALEERPNLKLDISGRADLEADAPGLRQRKLNRQIRKYLDIQEDGSSDKTISAASRERAIGKIYVEGKFDKPRNMLGFFKSVPAEEMERMILENTEITEDDLRNLANRRESAVNAYLAETAQVPAERMFSLAPKINGTDIKDKATAARVDFNLKM